MQRNTVKTNLTQSWTVKTLCLFLTLVLGLNGCLHTRPIATHAEAEEQATLRISEVEAGAINDAAAHGHGGNLKLVDGRTMTFSSLHIDLESVSFRGRGGDTSLPLAEVLEIRIRTRKRGHGALVGAAIGASVGAVFGALAGESDCSSANEGPGEFPCLT
jgi:hypothetical protein